MQATGFRGNWRREKDVSKRSAILLGSSFSNVRNYMEIRSTPMSKDRSWMGENDILSYSEARKNVNRSIKKSLACSI